MAPPPVFWMLDVNAQELWENWQHPIIQGQYYIQSLSIHGTPEDPRYAVIFMTRPLNSKIDQSLTPFVWPVLPPGVLGYPLADLQAQKKAEGYYPEIISTT